MNKKMYLGVYVTSLSLALVLLFGGILLLNSGIFPRNKKVLDLIGVAIGLGFFQFLIVYIVYPFVLLAKMWGAINDGYSRATPGQAIGFLFIPFYNLFWIFNVWGGFASDYNSYVERYNLPVPQINAGLYTVFPIFVVLSGLTSGFSLVVNFFLLIPIIAGVCNAVNSLNDAVRERHAQIAQNQMEFRPLQGQFLGINPN